MRNINDFKFRGYDTEYENMTYFDDEDYLLSYGQILRSKIEWNYDYDEEIIGYENVNNKIILMQYTGLKDENGKEIYEGDIIEFSYDMFVGNFDTFIAKGVVVFDEGAFYVELLENERTTKDESYLLYSINLDTIEVIGNKFENPELLGGE